MDFATSQLLNPNLPFTNLKLRALEQHINNIYSSDLNLVAESNQVLTQLKQQDGLLLSIQQILEQASLDRTKFYVLVVFEQRLPFIWVSLGAEQRQSLRQYFVGLFMKFARVDLTAETRPISSKITSVMVKLFLLGWQEWPTFIDDLVQQARNDQDICDSVMTALDMLADEMVEGARASENSEQNKPVGWSLERQAFVQSKLPTLAMLSLMIIQATTTNKLKQHLLKQTLQLLDKLVGLMQLGSGLPEQTISTLLGLIRGNVYRELVLKLLASLCRYFFTPNFARAVLDTIKSYLPNHIDLTVERAKLVELKNSKELDSFDSSMRNLASLLHRIVDRTLNQPTPAEDIILQCYAYILQLSMLQEKDIWASCLPSLMLIYYRQSQVNLPGSENLVQPLIWRCVKPAELLSRSADKEEANDYQFLVRVLSTIYLPTFEKVIWNIIESHIYVKFNRKKFEGACYCLCYLNSHYGPNDKEKLTNYFKLLLNLSESIGAEHRKPVVDQVLNIISFYPFVLRDNPFLAEVVERKFVENVPSSLRAIANAARNYTFSQQALQQLELKTISIQSEENSFEGTIKDIWEVLLVIEGRMYDAREASLTVDKAQILSYVLRNFAGLELFGLNYKLNWNAVLTVLEKNLQLMKQIQLQQGELALRFAKNSAHLRAQTCFIKLCCMYCRLYKQAGVSPILDQQFAHVAEWLLKNSLKEQTEQLVQLLH